MQKINEKQRRIECVKSRQKLINALDKPINPKPSNEISFSSKYYDY